MHTPLPCVPYDLDNSFGITFIMELLNTWRSGSCVGWMLYEWNLLVVESRRCGRLRTKSFMYIQGEFIKKLNEPCT